MANAGCRRSRAAYVSGAAQQNPLVERRIQARGRRQEVVAIESGRRWRPQQHADHPRVYTDTDTCWLAALTAMCV